MTILKLCKSHLIIPSGLLWHIPRGSIHNDYYFRRVLIILLIRACANRIFVDLKKVISLVKMRHRLVVMFFPKGFLEDKRTRKR